MPDITEIERDIAATRQSLATSLDALSAAVAPGNVKRHATAMAESYGDTLGRRARDAARGNPAAFALVGAGLGLLFTGTGTRPETKEDGPAAAPIDHALKGFDERVAVADSAMKLEMTGMMEPATPPRAAWLRAKMEDGLDALPDRARARVIKARNAALEAQEKVEEQARKTAQASRTYFQEQPLVVGAIALGLGALVGALSPATRREDELLGDRRDAVMAAAKSTLREEMDKLHQDARTKTTGTDA